MKPDQKRKLFARFLAGVSNEEEEKKILETSEIEGMMIEQWRSDPSSESQLAKPDLYRILASIYRKIASNQEKRTKQVPVRKFLFYRLSGAAAVLLISLSLGFYFWQTNKQTVTILAPEGVRVEVFLPDGSRVWLNSGGKINYKKGFDEESRNLKLSGEAFFNISNDPTRPFSVITSAATIEVMGTRFYVIADSETDTWETTLLSGSVKVYAAGDDKQNFTKLVPGQKAIWNTKNNNFTIKEVNFNQNSLGFTNQLHFDNEPLAILAKQLEETFGVKIDVPSSLAYKYRFTATFSDESIYEIFNLLKISAPIDFSVQGNKVVVLQRVEK